MTAKGFPLMKWRDQMASIHTLLLEEVARQAPEVSFVHTVPGVVRSGISRDARGFGIAIQLAIAKLFASLIETSPTESGEMHAFFATSAAFSPGSGDTMGVSLRDTVATIRGSNSDIGSGVYTISNKGECASQKALDVLARHRESGMNKLVWDYIMADYKRIVGTFSL